MGRETKPGYLGDRLIFRILDVLMRFQSYGAVVTNFCRQIDAEFTCQLDVRLPIELQAKPRHISVAPCAFCVQWQWERSEETTRHFGAAHG